ncbi:MAG: cytochrome c family protein [Rhodospirillum sp.]|nr:cytochrome c family protein [Rhodospirillum sp.]MCF8489676.1 cytochrome c family protein [Rhodospirillum sp.]MCF8501484.1 cytochrome c family protein [Rhodospirillum sp.]
MNWGKSCAAMALSLVLGATGALVVGSTAPLAQAAGESFEMGDAKAGEKVFRKCMACHEVGPGAKAKVGPPLTGVIGRHAGGVDGFEYSDAMSTKSQEGLVWTPENINHMLAKPKDFLPGTKMSFAGLRKDKERADVIAYLATFSDK